MASKMPFILGAAVGYVFGTRAGRERYESMKAAAARVADQPFVRTRLDAANERATAFVQQQGEALTDKMVGVVKERLFAQPQPREVEVESTVRPLRTEEPGAAQS